MGDALKLNYQYYHNTHDVIIKSVKVVKDTSPSELNAILFELDKAAVAGQIAIDHVDALMNAVLQDFTAAQLTEFIELSTEKHAVNCTAKLLDYKHKRFPEYANLTGFTLDW